MRMIVFQKTVLGLGVALVASDFLNSVASADDQDRTGFTILMMDKQFFTTPYERSGVLGGAYIGEEGSADAVIKNPAALGWLIAPACKAYWVYGSYKGNGGGTGPSTSESIRGNLSDEGAYLSLSIPSVPLVFGVGGDYVSTSFTDAPVTEPSQRGYRVSGALSAKVSDQATVGYGLTYFNDHHAWGTRFYVPGVMPPPKVNWVHNSTSWRNRVGFQYRLANVLTWGLHGDVGFGRGDNLWNGKNAGGGQSLSEYGARLGAKTVPLYGFSLLLDMEWRNMNLQFGNHEPMVGRTVLSEYAGNVYRIMAGVEHHLNEMLGFSYGYRYSVFRMDDFCYNNAKQNYNTVALGIDLSVYKKRVIIGYNAEYSWIAGGDFMNTVSIGYRF